MSAPTRPELPASEAKAIVRSGYDIASRSYRSDSGAESTQYGPWLAVLIDLLHDGARVLDLGCGNGMPAGRMLAEAGLGVVGVDISPVQIERAMTLLPQAELICADMTSVEFAEGSFDACISLYAIIHVPTAEQPSLFRRIHRWLKPGGYLQVIVGSSAWTGTEDDWHGTRMYWSHADSATYERWVGEAGFRLLTSSFVPEGDGGHTLLLARKE